MCQHYFSILRFLLTTNGQQSTPMCAAADTKAAENLGRARRRVGDGVLAIAHFLNTQHLPIPDEYLKRLFRHDASSIAFKTGYTKSPRRLLPTPRPKSKELASCLASSRFTSF